jgi:hypothetical protein
MNKYISKVGGLFFTLFETSRSSLRTQAKHWLLSYRFAAAGVGVALILALTVQIVHAACGAGNLSNFCSTSYGLVGNSSTLNLPASNNTPTQAHVDQAALLSSGPLFYPDYKVLETQARTLLDRSMKFRQDISPYRGINNFNDLVRHFDEKSGFSASYTDPVLGQLTLQHRRNSKYGY